MKLTVKLNGEIKGNITSFRWILFLNFLSICNCFQTEEKRKRTIFPKILFTLNSAQSKEIFKAPQNRFNGSEAWDHRKFLRCLWRVFRGNPSARFPKQVVGVLSWFQKNDFPPRLKLLHSFVQCGIFRFLLSFPPSKEKLLRNTKGELTHISLNTMTSSRCKVDGKLTLFKQQIFASRRKMFVALQSFLEALVILSSCDSAGTEPTFNQLFTHISISFGNKDYLRDFLCAAR